MALLDLYGNYYSIHMAVCQNLVPLVNIKIAGKWMSIPLKMVLIGIDPYPYVFMGVSIINHNLTITGSGGSLQSLQGGKKTPSTWYLP